MSLPPLKTSVPQDPESYLSVYYQILARYMNTTIRLFGLILSQFRFELSRMIIVCAAKVYYVIRGQPNVYDSSDLQLQHIASLIGSPRSATNYSHWNATSILKDYISTDTILRDVMSFDIKELVSSFSDVSEHIKLSQFEYSLSELYEQSDDNYASDHCLSVLFRHSEYDVRRATNTLHLTTIVSIQSLRRALTDKEAVGDKKTNEYLAKVGAYALYTLIYARMRQEFGRKRILEYMSDHLSVRALASLIVEKEAHAFVKATTSSSYIPNQVFATVALALYGVVFKGGGWPVFIDYHNNHMRLFKSL